MASQRRQRKRYGSVRSRSVLLPYAVRKDMQKAKQPRQLFYAIAANTHCEARKIGEKAWQPHVTLERIICDSFLWRNRTHHGFRDGDLELKVENGKIS